MSEVLAERYELGDELGSGGMARVIRAYDRTLARRVAVKLLHAGTISQTGMRNRFLSEARAAASFSHPHAVAVYDTGQDNGTPFIVMELVEGCSLADVLADRGSLPQAEAVAVASQVLSALGSAHKRGLVHRDVKPGNVLLPGCEVPREASGEPPAKLADFGIAKVLEEAGGALTATGQVLGTPKYVAPEQVMGGAATPRSDVYSLGVMLYEMLAGRPPFEAETAIALALAHREDTVPRIDRRVRKLDPGLAAIVHRALEKDPDRRYTDASEMRQALMDPRRAAAGGATAVASAGATRPLGRADTRPLPTEEPEGARRGAPWKPILVVAIVALALLGLAATDWEALTDRFSPGEPDEVDEEEPEEPEETEDPEPEDPDPDEPEPEPDLVPEPEPEEEEGPEAQDANPDGDEPGASGQAPGNQDEAEAGPQEA